MVFGFFHLGWIAFSKFVSSVERPTHLVCYISELHPSNCWYILLGHTTFYWSIIAWGSFGWFCFLGIFFGMVLWAFACQVFVDRLPVPLLLVSKWNCWIMWWLYLWSFEELHSRFHGNYTFFSPPPSHQARRHPVSPLSANTYSSLCAHLMDSTWHLPMFTSLL